MPGWTRVIFDGVCVAVDGGCDAGRQQDRQHGAFPFPWRLSGVQHDCRSKSRVARCGFPVTTPAGLYPVPAGNWWPGLRQRQAAQGRRDLEGGWGRLQLSRGLTQGSQRQRSPRLLCCANCQEIALGDIQEPARD